MSQVAGLVLAAGAGSRWGMPKALACDPDGTSWLARAAQVLRDGGCAEVTALLGACEGRAAQLAHGVATELVPEWREGLGATLAHGLRLCADRGADRGAREVVAVAIHLVDLPDVTADVVRRLLAPAPDETSLRRATFSGRPGHPVILGRDHWPALLADLTSAGDRGAGPFLRAHGVTAVECGDLATGIDLDAPPGGSAS